MVGYSYDNNGNQLNTPDGAALEYDWDNRMTKWTKQGQSEEYRYHPAGWRMWNSNDGSYLHGPGGQLLTKSATRYTDYVYFAGRLLFTMSEGQMDPRLTRLTRVYSDRLGSTRATWVATYGGGTTTRNYYPYGEEIGTPTANDQYKFASTYRDSTTSLDYAINRYYASGTGRFLTTDPKSGSARLENPGSWNRYSYGANNPVNNADPNGLDYRCRTWFDPEWGVERSTCTTSGDGGDEGEIDPPAEPPPSGGGTPSGSLTRDFSDRTQRAIAALSPDCDSALGGALDLQMQAANMRFFDARTESGDGSLRLSQVAPGNSSQATVYDTVNNRPDSLILNAVVVSGSPDTLGNSAVLVSGNFFKHSSTEQGLILVEEAMHAVRGLKDDDLRDIATKHGYGSFGDFLKSGCKDHK